MFSKGHLLGTISRSWVHTWPNLVPLNGKIVGKIVEKYWSNQPHDHRSAQITLYVVASPFRLPTSGAVQDGVPQKPITVVSSSFTSKDMLKSMMDSCGTGWVSSTRMFPGFKSRWAKLWSCMKETPSKNCITNAVIAFESSEQSFNDANNDNHGMTIMSLVPSKMMSTNLTTWLSIELGHCKDLSMFCSCVLRSGRFSANVSPPFIAFTMFFGHSRSSSDNLYPFTLISARDELSNA